MPMSLSPQELSRYSRQVLIDGWNQEKLRQSKILICGIGGLGGVTATYLAAAGVGEIRLVDFDDVELSNLNRQILYSTDDIGKSKVQVAGQRLLALNPDVKIVTRACRIDDDNISDLVSGCDLVIDGFDNHSSRLTLNRAAYETRIPYLYAAVDGWLGQVSLFAPPQTGCLACLMPDLVNSQSPIPVIGAMAGLIGSIQANEALKCLMGIGSLLLNQLLIYHGDTQQTELLSLTPNPLCKICAT